MPASLTTIVQRQAYKITLWQLALVVGLSLIIAVLRGINSGLSALLGGFAYGLPNLVFVWWVFRYASPQQATQFMFAFFVGETLKLILSAILFMLMVNFLPVQVPMMLLGYIAAIVAFWLVCMKYFSKRHEVV